MIRLIAKSLRLLVKDGPREVLVHLADWLRWKGGVIVRKLAPRNRFGDRLVALYEFVERHGRLPTDELIFSDVLYRIKTTDEILDPLRVFVTDKEFVKLFVAAVIGSEHNVPTIAVLRDMDEVRSYTFPRDCCVKPTHASGLAILKSDGSPIDLDVIASWFQTNYYDGGREANYKVLRPKVIVEPLIFGRTNVEDYKFFCYRGHPRLIQVDIDRHTNHTRKFFDMNWEEQRFSVTYPLASKVVTRPENLDEMRHVASQLSSFFSFVRIDLYSDGNRCLVGEITNCSGNAWERFVPQEAEAEASQLLFESPPR